ncbi:hypothetical protein [Moorena sp. SIO3I8]|nr:hypothetical protein [Moorena sp. SIO3I8]
MPVQDLVEWASCLFKIWWNRHLACSRSSGIGILPVQDLVE